MKLSISATDSRSDYSDVKDADCIIITAGIPRKEGETRLDLAKKNVKLAHAITDSIMEHYNKGVIMVISNPCDLVTYKVAEWSGLPSNKIIGSGTNLDSARFRVLISRKLGVDVRNVHGYILGEHGETQFPCWSHTHVAGMGIDEYAEAIGVPFGQDVKDEIAQQTKSSGAQIIKLKGATFNGIAVRAATLLRSITADEHTIRTVALIRSSTCVLQTKSTSSSRNLRQICVRQSLPLRVSDNLDA